MNRKWLIRFNLFWLIVVVPVLGLLPFSLLTGLVSEYSKDGRLAVTLLRSVRGIVFPDPYPEFSHLGFYELASKPVWWVVVAGVFCVGVVSLYFWWRENAKHSADAGSENAEVE